MQSSHSLERHLDLGHKPGRANVGDKLLTLVMSALAGGDCIDDAEALGSGGAVRPRPYAPPTGPFAPRGPRSQSSRSSPQPRPQPRLHR